MFERLQALIGKVGNRLFSRNQLASAGLGSTFLTDEMTAAIDRWAALYKNEAPWLAKDRHGMGLPSAIARELATLVTLEMQVTTTDPNIRDDETGEQKERTELNERAAFIKRVIETDVLEHIHTTTEYACALGGVVFKPYIDMDEKTVAVEVIHADDFYPTEFDAHGDVKGAIFLEHKRIGKDFYTRVERHSMNGDGYTITNAAFKSHSENDIGTPCDMNAIDGWEGIAPVTELPAMEKPLFAYFKIPQGNVIKKDSLLGVSVYARADAAGLLENADQQWQRLMWEYEGGELAIDASEDAFKRVKGADGQLHSVLPNGKERLFRVNSIDANNNSSEMLKVFSPTLRDSSIVNGLNQTLMRIEDMCGLARGTYSDANEQIRTATELKITRQRSYATVTAIQRSLERAINNLAWVLDYIADYYGIATKGEYAITYVWDDSIVVDAAVERENDRQDVRDGLMLPYEYRKKWYGESETQAKEILAESQTQSDTNYIDNILRGTEAPQGQL